MKSKTLPQFWKAYDALPKAQQEAALKAYAIFRKDPFHASLQFKVIQGRKNLYSVRLNSKYRALGRMKDEDTIVWFWIGTHDEYDTLLK